MTLNFSSRRVITLILLKQLSFIIFYLKFVPLDANYFFTKFLNSIKREDFAYSINVRPIRNAKLPTQNIILVARPSSRVQFIRDASTTPARLREAI